MLAGGRVVDGFGGAFDLNHAARRSAQVFHFGAGAVELVSGEQAAVGVARAQVLELHHAAHARLECVADGVQQVVQRGVVGGFFRPAAAAMNATHGMKEGFKRKWFCHEAESYGCSFWGESDFWYRK